MITLELEKPAWFVNLLRRLILEEAPSYAIEDLYIKQNNSALWDEWLANRLGQIPIKAPVEYIKEKRVIKGKFKVKGSKDGRWVYSKEIESEDENVKPAYDNIPIIWLEEWQEIDIDLEFKVGQGKVHSKWIPAHVWYYEDAYGILKKKDKEAKELIKKLGLELKGDKVYGDRTKLDALEREGIIELKKTGKYKFFIEGFGMVEEEEILPLAIDEFLARVKKYVEQLKNE